MYAVESSNDEQRLCLEMHAYSERISLINTHFKLHFGEKTCISTHTLFIYSLYI